VSEGAGLGHRLQRVGRRRRGQQAQQFLGDPLARQVAERAGIASAGVEARSVERRLAEPGMEAEEAQDAQ
jgi:CO/xanthine dehydrogenase Mo-binding subunit